MWIGFHHDSGARPLNPGNPLRGIGKAPVLVFFGILAETPDIALIVLRVESHVGFYQFAAFVVQVMGDQSLDLDPADIPAFCPARLKQARARASLGPTSRSATSKLNSVDPYRYLADVMTRDGHSNSRLDELLPWACPASLPLKAAA